MSKEQRDISMLPPKKNIRYSSHIEKKDIPVLIHILTKIAKDKQKIIKN